jgi:WD40 repeat protein
MKHSLLITLLLGGLTSLLALNSAAAQSTATPTNPPPTPTLVPITSITLTGHTSPVTVLAWSPDGSILASSAGGFDSHDNSVRLWQADGHPLAELTGHTMPVMSIAWSPDGTMLATGSQDQTIKLWQKDGKLRQTLQANMGIVFVLAWSPDGKTLASGSVFNPTQNTVQLWDTNGKLLKTLTTQFSGGKFYNLGWSPDGKYLVGGATDYSEWTLDGSLVFRRESCARCTPAWGFGWSPDSKLWAIGNESGLLWVYTVDGQQIAQLQSTTDVNIIKWSPDGKWMADGKNLWQINGNKFALKNYTKGTDSILDWSPDSRYIASAGNKVVYIQQADGKWVAILKDHTDLVDSIAWSPKGNLLASGANDNTIRLWDVTSLP